VAGVLGGPADPHLVPALPGPAALRGRRRAVAPKARQQAAVALLVALAVTALGAWLASGEIAPLAWRMRVAWFSGLLLAAWIPVELVVVWHLRSKKTLARVDG